MSIITFKPNENYHGFRAVRVRLPVRMHGADD